MKNNLVETGLPRQSYATSIADETPRKDTTMKLSENEYDVISILRDLQAVKDKPNLFFEMSPLFDVSINNLAKDGGMVGPYIRQYVNMRQDVVILNSRRQQ